MDKKQRQTIQTIVNNLCDYRNVLSKPNDPLFAEMPKCVANLLNTDIDELNRILWPEDYAKEEAIA